MHSLCMSDENEEAEEYTPALREAQECTNFIVTPARCSINYSFVVVSRNCYILVLLKRISVVHEGAGDDLEAGRRNGTRRVP